MIVVTAAVIEKDGKVLDRPSQVGRFTGWFLEAPGGQNEDPKDCLRRELHEEFGIDAKVGELISKCP